MALPLGFANAQGAAHAVAHELAARGDAAATPLPYNRFAPAESLWWVSPTRVNPAYRYGKYVFNSELGENSGAGFFCGLHVEKGFGAAAATVMTTAKERSHLMGPDWLWPRFLRAPPRDGRASSGEGVHPRVVAEGP